jgi:cell shape-determining protein MreD
MGTQFNVSVFCVVAIGYVSDIYTTGWLQGVKCFSFSIVSYDIQDFHGCENACYDCLCYDTV